MPVIGMKKPMSDIAFWHAAGFADGMTHIYDLDDPNCLSARERIPPHEGILGLGVFLNDDERAENAAYDWIKVQFG